MADWYVSSTAYAAIPQWAANTAYTVGQIIRPVTLATVASSSLLYAYRCTVAGTSAASETVWGGANNDGDTIAVGTATFMNVSGRSAHGWAAAAGSVYCMSSQLGYGRPAAGDRVFFSSDHSETAGGSMTWFFGNYATSHSVMKFISVNRAGSVPPVSADYLYGATINNVVGQFTFDPWCNLHFQGIKFVHDAAGNGIWFGSSGTKTVYFKNCLIVLLANNASARIIIQAIAKIVLDNTKIQFGNTGQYITNNSPLELVWINTPTALAGATMPATLFLSAYNSILSVTARGVDLSNLAGNLLTTVNSGFARVLLDHCNIHLALTRQVPTATGSNSSDEIELVECFNGTSIVSERIVAAGVVSLDRAVKLTGGATDDTGLYSLKLVSVVPGYYAEPLDSFWFDVENSAVGTAKTATVEVTSGVALNNNDLTLELHYPGTAGSSLTSAVQSYPDPLTPAAALPTSTASWVGALANKQKVQVTFTPQVAGRLRARVQLHKAAATVYINPQLTLT